MTHQNRILIIDDDIDMLNLLKDVFSYNQFEVYFESDPIQVLERFYENPKSFDIILLTIRLGNKTDRLGLYGKLKDADLDANIFVFTALELDLVHFRNICPSFGERFLIKKPILMRSLVERVNGALN
jgi:DNA-binding response OmpR family regulator